METIRRDQTALRLDALSSLIQGFAVIYGTDSAVRWASPSACDFLGIEPEEIVGVNAKVFLHPNNFRAFSRRAYGMIQKQEVPTGPVLGQLKRADGSWRWVETTFAIASAGDGDRPEVVTSCRDVHESKLSMERLAKDTRPDQLTGLPNRHSLIGTLDQLAIQGINFSLLICDLDGFADVNTNHGHSVGDVALQTMAERIRESVRPDDIVARIGGDEFAVTLAGASRTDAIAIARRIVEVAAKPVAVDGRSLALSMAVGIAEARLGLLSGQLIDAANVTMRRAKQRGKHQYAIG